MLKFIYAILLGLYFYSWGNSVIRFEEDPFNIAIKEISAKKLQTNIQRAIKAYEDGVYSRSVQILRDLLKSNNLSDDERAIIYLQLSGNFYKLKDEESMIGLIKSIDVQAIKDKYILYRIFQIASILFTERKNQDGIELILNKIKGKEKNINNIDMLLNQLHLKSAFNLYKENGEFISYRGVNFQLYKNIFPFDPNSRTFGELYIYIVNKDTTLLELSKSLGFGYYELKNANPYIDPFDVRENQLIVLPYLRIFPYEKFEYGNIYINIVEKRLYYPVIIYNKSYIITFPIGIGTDEAQSPIGEFKISEKRREPAWYPPESIRKEQPDLPKVFPPGPDNPLGTRAMRLGNTSFLMHGTNKEYGIGMKVSHGCIRMYNDDVEKLFEVVDIGTKVISKEIYFKRAEGKIEVFDEDGLRYADNGLSRLFLNIYKTDLFGKSFAIKPF